MTARFFVWMCVAATMLAVVNRSISAQGLRCERGDLEVRGLDFVGNTTFTDAQLASVIITMPSSWGRRTLNLPFSAKRCLDAAEFANDRLRLVLFYRRRGFPHVVVDTALPSDRGGVRPRFTIREGLPTQLRTLTIEGLDSLPSANWLTRDLPIQSGDRFDRVLISAAIDTIARRLRNTGYPHVSIEHTYGTTTDSAQGGVADDTIAVTPGPLTKIRDIHVSVTPARNRSQKISDNTVRRIIGIDSNSVYREWRLSNAQRVLYETDAYAHVAVSLDTANVRSMGRDTISVPLTVSLVENPMHAARAGLGYGTLDCFRATTELDDYNFLGGARRLELRGRVSKIGIGRPLDGWPSACPQANDDPYSGRLNYYLGATLRQPVFFGLRTVPTITAYTSRVSEYNAYVRTTSIGGIASLTWLQSRRTPLTFSYTMDYGRTEAQPALFCAVFNLCAPEDRERVQRNQRLAVASVVFSRDWTDNPIQPRRGGMMRAEVRHASPAVFSDAELRFNTILADVSRYFPLANGAVLAMRLRGGSVFGGNFIPPQERLYAGGPTTLRGFRQNELGAVTYTATGYDTIPQSIDPVTNDTTFLFEADPATRGFRRAVPVGGNSLVVANLELRFPSPVLPDILQLATFVDIGDVWNRGTASAFQNFQLKVTPGVQMSALSPVGPIRVILGYNPYRRPSGPLYFENTAAAGGALPCVSPGNNLSVRRDENGNLVQDAGECVSSFQPPRSTSFRSRLTLSLAIGQAF